MHYAIELVVRVRLSFQILVFQIHFFFFRARAVKKGIARHIDASTVANGKLANQIARLAAIVVKIMLLQREHKNQN